MSKPIKAEKDLKGAQTMAQPFTELTDGGGVLACFDCRKIIRIDEGDDCFHCRMPLCDGCSSSSGLCKKCDTETYREQHPTVGNIESTAIRSPMFVNQAGEMVHAYRLPPGSHIAIEEAPAWLQKAAFWTETGEMRIALRKTEDGCSTTTKLVILMHGKPIEADAGDWVVWLWNNEGIEFEQYGDTEFRQCFARTDH